VEKHSETAILGKFIGRGEGGETHEPCVSTVAVLLYTFSPHSSQLSAQSSNSKKNFPPTDIFSPLWYSIALFNVDKMPVIDE